MRKIVFDSPVEFDAHGALLFGLSAKTGDNPIGMFGTGLKYTIAVLLRNVQEIKIVCQPHEGPATTYEFVLVEGTFRGTGYLEIYLKAKNEFRPLGFTTELGLNWSMEDVYRELWCNTKDEGGEVYEALGGHLRESLSPGSNRIIVTGSEFAQEHDNRKRLIIEDPDRVDWVYENDDIAIARDYPSKGIFYRGIRVVTSMAQKSYQGTYLFKRNLTLTEDRTLKYWHQAAMDIGVNIIKVKDTDWCKRWLKDAPHQTEGNMPIHFSGSNYSPEFLKAAEEIYKADVGTYHAGLRDVVLQVIYGGTWPTVKYNISKNQRDMYKKAEEICREMGYDVGSETKVRFVQELTATRSVLGVYKVRGNEILLSKRAFEAGMFQLTATLLEELVHRDEGYMDESYGMQNFLLERWLSTFVAMKKMIL